MKELLNEDVTITVEIKASADVGYIDDYDITNNISELVNDNLSIESFSDGLRIKDVNVKDVF